MIRQPLRVCAIIGPFNVPGMIPFWFLPYAIACGNTVLVNPSERVPLTVRHVFALLDGVTLRVPPRALHGAALSCEMNIRASAASLC